MKSTITGKVCPTNATISQIAKSKLPEKKLISKGTLVPDLGPSRTQSSSRLPAEEREDLLGRAFPEINETRDEGSVRVQYRCDQSSRRTIREGHGHGRARQIANNGVSV
jgi:hypothetical protein